MLQVPECIFFLPFPLFSGAKASLLSLTIVRLVKPACKLLSFLVISASYAVVYSPAIYTYCFTLKLMCTSYPYCLNPTSRPDVHFVAQRYSWMFASSHRPVHAIIFSAIYNLILSHRTRDFSPHIYLTMVLQSQIFFLSLCGSVLCLYSAYFLLHFCLIHRNDSHTKRHQLYLLGIGILLQNCISTEICENPALTEADSCIKLCLQSPVFFIESGCFFIPGY